MDYSGNSISKNDTLLRIQHFVLSENEKKQKLQIPPKQENNHRIYKPTEVFYFLPPCFMFKNRCRVVPNQRLILIYSQDTMTIDFIGVMNENGAGYSDNIKYIYFRPGYYKTYRNPQDKIEGFGDSKERMDILNALHNGINTSTDHILKSRGLLLHLPDPNEENKRLERLRKACLEELVQAPFYRLCEHQIDLHDSTIYLKTARITPAGKDSNLMHLIYYFSFRHYAINPNAEFKKASEKLQPFQTFNLNVNGEPYSGILKLAVPFNNAGISSKYSGCDLWLLTYDNGILMGLQIKHDVDIISEHGVARPQ